ncbi:MAG: SPFH domain-containing protein, partial [Coriobacteriia bacterium]|nr:SPFH domain-containing protein [Coriobacteriia bacterium]
MDNQTAQGQHDSNLRSNEQNVINSMKQRKPSNNARYTFEVASFILLAAIAFLVAYFTRNVMLTVIVAALMFFAFLSVHITLEWEKAVILRLGKFSRVVGPGVYFKWPIIESVAALVDQRTIATPFQAEEALTADLVPLAVDAVFFWMVWDSEMACTDVENYPEAIYWTAQTTLRDVIGRVNIDAMSISREQLNNDIQHIMDEKTTPWGVSVTSVEIRDIVI